MYQQKVLIITAISVNNGVELCMLMNVFREKGEDKLQTGFLPDPPLSVKLDTSKVRSHVRFQIAKCRCQLVGKVKRKPSELTITTPSLQRNPTAVLQPAYAPHKQKGYVVIKPPYRGSEKSRVIRAINTSIEYPCMSLRMECNGNLECLHSSPER